MIPLILLFPHSRAPASSLRASRDAASVEPSAPPAALSLSRIGAENRADWARIEAACRPAIDCRPASAWRALARRFAPFLSRFVGEGARRVSGLEFRGLFHCEPTVAPNDS